MAGETFSFEDATAAPASGNTFSFEDAQPKTPQGAISYLASQAKAGLTADLPTIAGKALQYAGATNVGGKLRAYGEANAAEAQPDESQGAVTKMVAGAIRGAMPVVPLAVAGLAAQATPLAPAVDLAGAAGLAAAFGGSQAQDTFEKAKATGLSDEQATGVARKTGLITGAGMGAVGMLTGGLAAPAVRAAAAPVAKTAAESLAQTAAPAFVRPLVAETAGHLAGNVASMAAANAGVAGVEQAAGLPGPTPGQAALEGVESGASLTAALLPFGVARTAIARRANAAAIERLQSEKTDPQQRAQIAAQIQQNLQAVDPQAAQHFANNVGQSIDLNQPIKLGEHLLSPYESPATEKAPVQPPEAPDLTTTAGAAPPREGVDFTRDVDTSGLSLVDEQEQARQRAATVDFQKPDMAPNWDTAAGAKAPREGLEPPVREFDTSGLSVKPSEAMGIDPSAGPVSRVAAIAVDSGAHQQSLEDQASAQARAESQRAAPRAQEEQEAPPVGTSAPDQSLATAAGATPSTTQAAGVTQGLADFLGHVVKRHVMEEQGRSILDDMESRGESPRDVADKFWTDTYFKLPAEAQARFRKMAANHGGEGILTEKDKPSDVFDLPSAVEHLEGTERGFVALMKEGNDRFADTGAPNGQGLEQSQGAAGEVAARVESAADRTQPQVVLPQEAGAGRGTQTAGPGEVANAFPAGKPTPHEDNFSAHAARLQGDELDSVGALADKLPENTKSQIPVRAALRQIGFTEPEIKDAIDASKGPESTPADRAGAGGAEQGAQAQAQGGAGQRAGAARGVQSTDIVGKDGKPFRNRIAAGSALKVAGKGYEVAPVEEGGFVVRKRQAQPAEAKPLAVGITPNNAEPVAVKNGVIHIGKDPAIDFESGEPVKVKDGASEGEIRQALKDAGALSKRQKFFGGQAEAALPAVKQQLFVERGGKRFPVDSLEDASRKWQEFRDRTGAGFSEIGTSTRVTDQDGKEVARIAYNGNVFPPGEWNPGTKPLLEADNVKRTVAPPKGEPNAIPQQGTAARSVLRSARAGNEEKGPAVGSRNAEPEAPAAARQEQAAGNGGEKAGAGVAARSPEADHQAAKAEVARRRAAEVSAEATKPEQKSAVSSRTARTIATEVAKARPDDDVAQVREAARKAIVDELGQKALDAMDKGSMMTSDELTQAVHEGQYQAVREYAAKMPVPVHESDIPRDAANAAHRGTSFSPERRGASEQRDYVRTMVDAWKRAEAATKGDPEALARVTEQMRAVVDGYRSRVLNELGARSRIVSSMIAGPAKFPAERMRKANETADRRAQEAREFLSKGIARMLRAARAPIDNSPDSELAQVRANLEAREKRQETMKAVNAALRKGDDAPLKALGLSDAQIAELKKPDFAVRTGFPDYKLKNNNAEIRRLRERLKSAEARVEEAAAGPAERTYNGVRIEENAQDDRLRLHFEGKPSEEVRSDLKANGFRWSPNAGAWQRQLTDNARQAAKEVLDKHFPPSDPMFARSDKSDLALTQTQIQRAVNKLTLDWLKKPEIHVLRSMKDAPEPVRKVWESQNAQGAAGEIDGFHYKGGVYIVADQMRSGRDVIRVLYHEALGHFGLRQVFGDKLDSVLQQVARAKPDEMTAKAAQYGLNLVNQRERMMAAEELLAEMAEKRPELSFVKNAVAAIRTFLREHIPGFADMKMTDAEIVRNFLAPARNFVENGKRAEPSFARGTNQPMASRKVVGTNEGERSAGDNTERWPDLRDALRRYNETFELTGPDLLNEVERMVEDGDAPRSLHEAINNYRAEIDEDLRQWGGRGDLDSVEQSFVDAVERATNESSAPNRNGAVNFSRTLDKAAETLDRIKDSEAVGNVKTAWDGLQMATAPQYRSPAAMEVARTLIAGMGERELKGIRFRKELNDAIAQSAEATDLSGKARDLLEKGLTVQADKVFLRQSKEENQQFMQAMDTGDEKYFAAHHDLKPMADVISRMFDEKAREIQALGTGALQAIRENYFPHIWSKEPSGDKQREIFTTLSKRPLEGSKAFAKQRVFEDVQAGLDAGFEPISSNPLDIVALKMAEMDKYLLAHKTLQSMEGTNGVHLIPAGEKTPQGFADVNGRFGSIERNGQKLRYVARDDVAQVINNYLSQSLYHNKYVGKPFTAYMGAANLLNQFQLGVFSAFHAGFTSFEAVISHASIGVKALTAGDFKGAAKYLGSAPAAWINNPKMGSKIIAEMLNTGAHPEMAQIIQGLQLAGFKWQMDNRFRTDATKGMIQAWNEGKKFKAGINSIGALTEQTARPILEWLVPRQKFGVFGEMYNKWIEDHPNATHEELRNSAQQIWNRVDSRLGQVVYDRLFMHNVTKNFAQMLIRAPGWTGGTILEVGGGLKDLAGYVKALASGEKPPSISDRAAYTLSMLMTTAIANAALTAMFTGQAPDDWKDLVAFRSGNLDEHGRPERFMLPTYMKDVYAYAKAPGTTLMNKTHPLLSLIGDVAKNRDYFGTEIRSEDDNLMTQLAQTAGFTAKAFVPFWVKGVQKEQERGGSALATAAPLIGVMPAPSDLNKSAAEKLMTKYSADRAPQGSRTQEEADKSQLRQQMYVALRKGDQDKARELFEQGKSQGLFAARDYLRVVRQARLDPLVSQFSHLTYEQAQRVMKVASDEEKRELAPLMMKKRVQYLRQHQGSEQPA